MSDAAHDSHDETQFTLRNYLIGFAASAALTVIPFWIVMSGSIGSKAIAASVIVALAVAQIIVQTSAFLHLNARAQGGWNLVAYVFTTVLVVIIIGGSTWIMYHLNSNMMPGLMSPSTSEIP
ncbi:MAG: cytochrome o ubiquinol oxidase subunit IV [Steroidobacteraceae bacterium]